MAEEEADYGHRASRGMAFREGRDFGRRVVWGDDGEAYASGKEVGRSRGRPMSREDAMLGVFGESSDEEGEEDEEGSDDRPRGRDGDSSSGEEEEEGAGGRRRRRRRPRAWDDDDDDDSGEGGHGGRDRHRDGRGSGSRGRGGGAPAFVPSGFQGQKRQPTSPTHRDASPRGSVGRDSSSGDSDDSSGVSGGGDDEGWWRRGGRGSEEEAAAASDLGGRSGDNVTRGLGSRRDMAGEEEDTWRPALGGMARHPWGDDEGPREGGDGGLATRSSLGRRSRREDGDGGDGDERMGVGLSVAGGGRHGRGAPAFDPASHAPDPLAGDDGEGKQAPPAAKRRRVAKGDDGSGDAAALAAQFTSNASAAQALRSSLQAAAPAGGPGLTNAAFKSLLAVTAPASTPAPPVAPTPTTSAHVSPAVPVQPVAAKFEKHTKGFGSKYLAKFGFSAAAGGLGKHGQGITQPITVQVRPERLGLAYGDFHEASRLPENRAVAVQALPAGHPDRIAAEREEWKERDRSEASNVGATRRMGPTKPAGLKKKKPVYKTAAQILAEDDARVGAGGNGAGVGTILDMRGATARILASAADIGTAAEVQLGTEHEEHRRGGAADDRFAGLGKELLHNLTVLVDLAEVELHTLHRTLRTGKAAAEAAQERRNEAQARSVVETAWAVGAEACHTTLSAAHQHVTTAVSEIAASLASGNEGVDVAAPLDRLTALIHDVTAAMVEVVGQSPHVALHHNVIAAAPLMLAPVLDAAGAVLAPLWTVILNARPGAARGAWHGGGLDTRPAHRARYGGQHIIDVDEDDDMVAHRHGDGRHRGLHHHMAGGGHDDMGTHTGRAGTASTSHPQSVALAALSPSAAAFLDALRELQVTVLRYPLAVAMATMMGVKHVMEHEDVAGAVRNDVRPEGQDGDGGDDVWSGVSGDDVAMLRWAHALSPTAPAVVTSLLSSRMHGREWCEAKWSGDGGASSVARDLAMGVYHRVLHGLQAHRLAASQAWTAGATPSTAPSSSKWPVLAKLYQDSALGFADAGRGRGHGRGRGGGGEEEGVDTWADDFVDAAGDDHHDVDDGGDGDEGHGLEEVCATIVGGPPSMALASASSPTAPHVAHLLPVLDRRYPRYMRRFVTVAVCQAVSAATSVQRCFGERMVPVWQEAIATGGWDHTQPTGLIALLTAIAPSSALQCDGAGHGGVAAMQGAHLTPPTLTAAPATSIKPTDIHPPTIVDLLLPTTYRRLLSGAVVARLVSAVEGWSPQDDPMPIHAWLLPWVGPHLLALPPSPRHQRALLTPLDAAFTSAAGMDGYAEGVATSLEGCEGGVVGPLSTTVFPLLQRRMAAVLAEWHPSDASARVMLAPWRGAWSTPVFTNFITSYILPHLARALRTDLVINPADQDMVLWDAVAAWWDWVPQAHVEALLEGEFFPRWYAVLVTWLAAPGVDVEEVAAWYEGWKAAVPAALLTASSRLQAAFAVALDVMTEAVTLEGGVHHSPAAAALPKPGAISYLSVLEARGRGSGARMVDSGEETVAVGSAPAAGRPASTAATMGGGGGGKAAAPTSMIARILADAGMSVGRRGSSAEGAGPPTQLPGSGVMGQAPSAGASPLTGGGDGSTLRRQLEVIGEGRGLTLMPAPPGSAAAPGGQPVYTLGAATFHLRGGVPVARVVGGGGGGGTSWVPVTVETLMAMATGGAAAGRKA